MLEKLNPPDITSPLGLIFYEAYNTASDAKRREKIPQNESWKDNLDDHVARLFCE